MTARRQLVQIVRKDLRIEARSGEAVLVTTPFGAVALMFVPLAVGTDTPLLRQIGPGLYWVVVLLFGLLVTLRHSSVDTPAQIALLRLSGVHPVVRLTGRAVASALLLLAFEVLLLPVAVALYDPASHGWPWLLPVLPLVATGLGLLGTLAGALAQGLGGRTTLGPVLVLPLAVPLLLGATQVPVSAALGNAPWPWLLLMFTVDLIAVLALLLSAPHLEEVA
ncbi:heme exporter protein CcmB [Lentzea sp. HUAS TT2]|uniref:heme exporter protein CcmB n=1 Tax=Lentzea sp. HUAS TT2 TaxID=3447454 RepID=UPI003F70D537